MQSIFAIVFMIFAFLALTERPSAARPARFDFPELEKIIRHNQITELDDLLGYLPPVMRKNALLAYDSRGLNRELVTLATPRIVLFNEDASLVLALTRNPGKKRIETGRDRLEISRFDPKARRFEFMELTFDGVNSPFSRPVPKNPATCLGCHGQDPRPLFHDYNTWPGFYGSFG